MSIPSNADNSVEEEISDMSFVRNEGNSNVNKEPVFTFVPIKEEKSNILSENNIDLKSELYEIKQECVLHEHVKEDISFRSYGVNLKESQEDPLATNCSDIENNMKEYPSIGHIKEEMNTEIQEEHEDIDECKLESPFANDDMNTNIYEENTPGSDSDGRDTASVKAQRNRTLVKNYGCNECCKMFSSKQYLMKHIDSVHRGNKKYKCNECSRYLSSPQMLRMHIDCLHKGFKKHGHKIYECSMCLKMLSSSQNVRLHIESVHKGNKRYECTECRKTFSTNRYLKMHVDIKHMGNKMHECSDCHKMYSSKYILKQHIDSIHQGIKKYECYDCNRSFSEYAVLKTHITAAHKKIKSNKCNECGKLFLQAGDLKRHISGVHLKICENRKYDCGECHKSFSRRNVLTKHIFWSAFKNA